jgi:hypothetical protein
MIVFTRSEIIHHFMIMWICGFGAGIAVSLIVALMR